MSASRKVVIFCSLLLAGSASGVAVAKMGGIIHFKGAIVEPLCDVDINVHNVQTTCQRAGQVRTSTIAIKSLINKPQTLQNVATMKMQYLNTTKTLAILDIAYN